MKPPRPKKKPLVISTWIHGLEANEAAWKVLAKGGSALDAVEAGVRVTESDPESQSVGYGGLPDRDGNVTLDACIMDHEQGAQEFALSMGFERKDLLTPASKEAWLKWKESMEQKRPPINQENHDTIGMLALDKDGNLSGACTTSGWAYKMPGRVGDSPIIGAGLFVDNEVGAACATGMGEAIVRVAGSSIVVEMMRQGMSPAEACKAAVLRIKAKHKDLKDLQVGFLAMNKAGEVGAYSMYAGFNYARQDRMNNEMIDAEYELEW
jgi:isoaspartyl peptidase/L-asparaginase-like protein (Ntn-hydrolase superfamily)